MFLPDTLLILPKLSDRIVTVHNNKHNLFIFKKSVILKRKVKSFCKINLDFYICYCIKNIIGLVYAFIY